MTKKKGRAAAPTTADKKRKATRNPETEPNAKPRRTESKVTAAPAIVRERALTIREASLATGISASMIRAWEKIGIVQPARSGSTYRLYNDSDIARLRRAVYLRKYRGLNAAAIVEQLQIEGPPANGTAPQQRDPAGAMLRRLRLQKGQSLGDVATAAGISVGFLSNLERGQAAASVGTMHRLVSHFGVHTLDFFDRAERPRPLVRPKDRKKLSGGAGVSMELLSWGPIIMEPHLFVIQPGGHSGPSYKHEGQEFLFVLSGQFSIFLEDEEFILKRGDSFYFESSRAHHWSNPGKIKAAILWINTPPTF